MVPAPWWHHAPNERVPPAVRGQTQDGGAYQEVRRRREDTPEAEWVEVPEGMPRTGSYRKHAEGQPALDTTEDLEA